MSATHSHLVFLSGYSNQGASKSTLMCRAHSPDEWRRIRLNAAAARFTSTRAGEQYSQLPYRASLSSHSIAMISLTDFRIEVAWCWHTR